LKEAVWGREQSKGSGNNIMREKERNKLQKVDKRPSEEEIFVSEGRVGLKEGQKKISFNPVWGNREESYS